MVGIVVGAKVGALAVDALAVDALAAGTPLDPLEASEDEHPDKKAPTITANTNPYTILLHLIILQPPSTKILPNEGVSGTA